MFGYISLFDEYYLYNIKKIGTPSVHVGSRTELSQDTPNYNCTSVSCTFAW